MNREQIGAAGAIPAPDAPLRAIMAGLVLSPAPWAGVSLPPGAVLIEVVCAATGPLPGTVMEADGGATHANRSVRTHVTVAVAVHRLRCGRCDTSLVAALGDPDAQAEADILAAQIVRNTDLRRFAEEVRN